MGYHINYNPEMKDRYPTKVDCKKNFLIRKIVVSIVVGVFVVGIVVSGALRSLIPGDAAVTVAAFSGMVEDIEAGETVRQAFLSFCKEIIVNAK